MKYYACLKILNEQIPKSMMLDEFVEYAAKLPIKDDEFKFQEIIIGRSKYIGIEIEKDLKIHFPLEKIELTNEYV